ncbi:hypothetical protein [Fibrobacter sp. UWH6]|uniref:hypothetical protein n=1 Tax=Fibrobacter sp. (strain UWH6) TaxID=1896212 RepID=UPI000914A029|nr:hypothetical protein [Fibrobacter sp. UWH6]SHL25873.1 hypothetical protein SAMN05720765_1124 [Fibrobacter sp. UWH6]
MKFRFSLTISLAALVVLSLFGCAVTRKISAADILSKTKLEFNALTLDSVSINKDLFPKQGLFNGFLPNPQVVALVQDFAKGKLEKELGTLGLSAEVIAKNQGTDTLWIRDLQATLKLDTLMELPISLKDSIKMVPGSNNLTVTTTMPIDRRIFWLKDVSLINMKGVLTVALDVDGESVPLEFDIDRPVSQEEKTALMDNVRNTILNSVVNNWMGAIQK